MFLMNNIVLNQLLSGIMCMVNCGDSWSSQMIVLNRWTERPLFLCQYIPRASVRPACLPRHQTACHHSPRHPVQRPAAADSVLRREPFNHFRTTQNCLIFTKLSTIFVRCLITLSGSSHWPLKFTSLSQNLVSRRRLMLIASSRSTDVRLSCTVAKSLLSTPDNQ